MKEKIPISQIGQITSTDLAAGVLVSQGYTAFVNPGSTIAAGAGATALQTFVNAGGTYIGSVANGTTSARNAGITLLNTSTISGLSTPGSTFDGVFSTATPAGWGFDTGGWIYRSASGDPTFNPATMVGNGTTIPAPTAVVTYGPSGDCGGPVFDISSTAAWLQQLLRLRGQREQHAAGGQHEHSRSRAGRRSSTSRSARATRS